jgi:hypothetical protein
VVEGRGHHRKLPPDGPFLELQVKQRIFKGLIDKEGQPGLILALLSIHSFDHFFLFDAPNTQRVTQETKDAIIKFHGHCEVDVLPINLDTDEH